MAKSARGEKVETSTKSEVHCPDGHGPMRLVDENDRLKIVEQAP
jgi:hypothetical protein